MSIDLALRMITEQFVLEGTLSDIYPFGNGHINDTYAVVRMTPNRTVLRYALQKVNQYVFPDVDRLMRNIDGITAFLSQKIDAAGGDSQRETLRIIPTAKGELYHRDEAGECWRIFSYIENTISLEQAESIDDFYHAAVAFGKFQRLLCDYDASTLSETIPFFHHTPKRFLDFEKAVKEDVAGRAAAIEAEIRFLTKRKKDASYLLDLLEKKQLPLRVTHNDTKLNNVLLDKTTREAVCVVDLDTVMPGLCHYDFGDAIRFGASTAAEDETDLDKVNLDMDLFEAFSRGFLEETGNILTRKEISTLAWGARIMTLECGIRFLTDYLQGDLYFKTQREQHNLERARNQFKLVSDMESKWEGMCAIIDRFVQNEL